MRCLDHIDMAALTGAVAALACAGFFFAYLGVEREVLAPPAMASSAAFLQEELAKAIDEAVVTPARLTAERQRTQVALGQAIRELIQMRQAEKAFFSDLARRTAVEAGARREFLEGVFKLPSDWRGTEFLVRERAAAARAQEELGRRIVGHTQAFSGKKAAAETRYGHALVAAIGAVNRSADEPGASQATMLAAATAAKSLAERTAPAPAAVIARDPSWGFGSIGDGAFIPIAALGAGAFLLIAGGIGMTGAAFSTRAVAAHCDEKEKDVLVEMLVSDETPYEVLHCSAFNGGPITCDKRCLQWPMAFERPLAHAA